VKSSHILDGKLTNRQEDSMKKPLCLLLCLVLQTGTSVAFVPAAVTASSPLATVAAAARITTSTQAPSTLLVQSSPLFQSKRRRPFAASTLPQDSQQRRGRQAEDWEQEENEQGIQETEKRERKPILSTLVGMLASKLLRKTARRVSGLDIDVGARSNSDVLAGNLPLVKVREICVWMRWHG
jgi:hypothetical protein